MVIAAFIIESSAGRLERCDQKICFCGIKIKFIFSLKHSDYRSTDDITATCPPALKCLVFVWDELNKDFQTFVNKILSNKDNKEAAPVLKPNDNDLNDTDNSKTKPKNKKFNDDGNASIGAVGGTVESTVWCELCDIDIVPGSNLTPYQQNAFTQHLKTNHSGCGESSKGKGYNANGVYCEGKYESKAGVCTFYNTMSFTSHHLQVGLVSVAKKVSGQRAGTYCANHVAISTWY